MIAEDDAVGGSVAYIAARRGYEYECRMQGREPNYPHFDNVVAALLGAANVPVEQPTVPLGPTGRDVVERRLRELRDQEGVTNDRPVGG